MLPDKLHISGTSQYDEYKDYHIASFFCGKIFDFAFMPLMFAIYIATSRSF